MEGGTGERKEEGRGDLGDRGHIKEDICMSRLLKGESLFGMGLKIPKLKQW